MAESNLIYTDTFPTIDPGKNSTYFRRKAHDGDPKTGKREPRKAKIVYLEGGKGTGKSKTLELLRERIDADYPAGIVCFDPLRETQFEAQGIKDHRRAYLQIMGPNVDEQYIQMLLSITRYEVLKDRIIPNLGKPNKIFFQQRGITTTLTHQLAYAQDQAREAEEHFGQREAEAIWRETLTKQGGLYLIPDLTIFLTCDPQITKDRIIREARSEGRDVPGSIDLERLIQIRAIHETIKPAIPNSVIIDNSELDEEQNTARVYQEMRRRGILPKLNQAKDNLSGLTSDKCV